MGVAAFPTDTDARESLKAQVERIFSQLKLNVYFPSWVHRISYNQTGRLSSVGQHRVCVHTSVCLNVFPTLGFVFGGVFPGVVGVHRYVSTYV